MNAAVFIIDSSTMLWSTEDSIGVIESLAHHRNSEYECKHSSVLSSFILHTEDVCVAFMVLVVDVVLISVSSTSTV